MTVCLAVDVCQVMSVTPTIPNQLGLAPVSVSHSHSHCVVSPFSGSGAGSKAVMDIQGLWHPCAVSRVAGDAVVPNDLVLGSLQSEG